MQRNWIGRSEGAEIQFRIDELDDDVAVFTTRPDTLFGATFFVLAPEHPLVEQLAERSPNGEELRDYVRTRGAKRGEERAAAEEKTGVFTGFFATNPVNEARIPIWVADYVLMDYGTGAIMAVPAHDERDREFAETLRPADRPGDRRGREADRLGAVHRRCRRRRRRRAIVEWLDERGRAKQAISYRLRDWGFSRQRYWGCPIPIVYCDDCGTVPVPDEELPVLLPDLEDFKPKGIAPLAQAEDWVNVAVPAVRQARRGARPRRWTPSSTRPGTSCATRTRTTSEAPWRRELADYWNPVDQYIGGVDHTTMHMIYARFFMKALNDLGLDRLPRAVRRVLHERLGATSAARRCRSRRAT